MKVTYSKNIYLVTFKDGSVKYIEGTMHRIGQKYDMRNVVDVQHISVEIIKE